jgi:hypothetical protein
MKPNSSEAHKTHRKPRSILAATISDEITVNISIAYSGTGGGRRWRYIRKLFVDQGRPHQRRDAELTAAATVVVPALYRYRGNRSSIASLGRDR